MKKHLVTLVTSGVVWICTGFIACAQTSPVQIGHVKELWQALTFSSSSRQTKEAYPVLQWKLGAHEVLQVQPRAARKADDDHYSFVGGVKGDPSSAVFLSLKDDQASGRIILKDQKKAYLLYSDEAGRVFATPEDPNRMICLDFHAADEHALQEKQNVRTAQPLASDVYALQSLPGSDYVVLLDFDGEYFSHTGWAGGGILDARPSGMTAEDIQEAWEIVSEDYRPFDLNITTDAAVFAQAKPGKRMRCVITPTNDMAPGYGGIAYVGSFTWTGYEEPCWAFTTGVGTGGKNVGEACSHEIGHTLYLTHDGRLQPAESYYAGAGDWAPIMGVGYYKNLVQFSKGEYLHANNPEDDIHIITTQNGFSFRHDDHGNTASSASVLKVSATGMLETGSNRGVIETSSDVDVFAFSTSGGICTLSVHPAERHANLDVALSLYTENGELLRESALIGLEASLSDTLSAGSYFLKIEGSGSGNPLEDGYTDYASLGAYSLSGFVPQARSNRLPVVRLTAPQDGAAVNAPATLAVEALASDPDGTVVKVEFFSNGVKEGEDTQAPYEVVWMNLSAGTYKLSARAIDNDGGVMVSEEISITVRAATLTCKGIPDWMPDKVYASPGQQVAYQGLIFENRWWTQHEKPDVNDTWGVWKFVSGCQSGENILPEIFFTSPQSLYGLEGDETVLTVNASDADGLVRQVDFYDNDLLMGTVHAFPFTLRQASASVGTHRYKAVATDNLGAQSEVELNVWIDAAPAFLSPLPDSEYPFAGTLELKIDGKGAEERIRKVEYFLYGLTTKIGEAPSPPYHLSFGPLPDGTSSQGGYLPVLARVTYTGGQVIVLNTYIRITGDQEVNFCKDIAAYRENGGYEAGSTVQAGHRLYECKPWPYSGWCNGAAFAYAPGTGSAWQDAWTDKGSCTAGNRKGKSDPTVFRLSPNPSEGILQLQALTLETESSLLECKVFNAAGDEVFSLRNYQPGAAIDLSTLAQGFYHVVISTEDRIWQYPWIKL